MTYLPAARTTFYCYQYIFLGEVNFIKKVGTVLSMTDIVPAAKNNLLLFSMQLLLQFFSGVTQAKFDNIS